MKGKSPFNKPSLRKTEVYKLLLKLGGEAQWKDLKDKLDKLGWGPTTLKQTLDEMVEEATCHRTLGQRRTLGPQQACGLRTIDYVQRWASDCRIIIWKTLDDATIR